MGEAIGSDVQDISSPVVRLILTDVADDAGCASAYWPEQPGIAFTVSLRLFVSSGSFDAEMEANLKSGVTALLYTTDGSVRVESVTRMQAQTDVVAEVAATSETNAVRIAELLLTQMDAALTSAVGVAVTSRVPTVRSLLVETASALDAAVLPSPPPPPATPIEGDGSWFTGGVAAGVVIGAVAGMVLLGCIVVLVLRSPRAHNCLGGKKPNNITEARIPGQLHRPTSSELTTAGATGALASPGTAAHVTATRDAGSSTSGSLAP